MKFWVVRSQQVMSVDNAVVNDLDVSSLPGNVEMVLWDGMAGEVESNIGPAIRTPFTDPAPYQPVLNSFLGLLPNVTVLQARQIKQQLVEAIYAARRLTPIRITVGSGTFYWDARDEALTAMTSKLMADWLINSSSSVSTLAAMINNALAGVATEVNTKVVAPLRTGTSDSLKYYQTETGTERIIVSGMTGGLFMSKPDQVVAQSTNFQPVISNISWLPHDSKQVVSLTNIELANIVSAIVGRRNALSLTRANKRVDLQTVTTVAGVIAYDATQGW